MQLTDRRDFDAMTYAELEEFGAWVVEQAKAGTPALTDDEYLAWQQAHMAAEPAEATEDRRIGFNQSHWHTS